MAPLSSSLVARLKVQLKLSISRLRMTQQRDMALAKQQRRAMALLLEQYKIESARIRIENIIRSDIMTELYEVLELYCELLLARSQLLETNMNVPSFASNISNATASALTSRKSKASAAAAAAAAAKQPPDPLTATQDPGLDEAIRSIIFAAPRTEIKELMQVRQLLLEKFGKDVGLQAMDGVGVAERVLKKLKVETPAKSLVDAYLGEIARTYGIAWPDDDGNEDDEDDEDSDDSDEDDDEPSSGQKVAISDKNGKKRPEEQLEPPLTEDVMNTTESTSAKPIDSPITPTTATAEGEAEKDEQLRLRSASSPPRGDVANYTPPPLRINPPSPRTDNAQPRLKLPRPPEEKPGVGKKKKKKGKKDKIKGTNMTSENVGKDGDEKNDKSKALDEIMNGGGEKSGQPAIGKAVKAKGGSDVANDHDKPGGKIPDVDELARRFAELKR